MTTKPVTPLPCPVCGREPKTTRFTFVKKWETACDVPSTRAGHMIWAEGKDAEDAIKRWNRCVGRKK